MSFSRAILLETFQRQTKKSRPNLEFRLTKQKARFPFTVSFKTRSCGTKVPLRVLTFSWLQGYKGLDPIRLSPSPQKKKTKNTLPRIVQTKGRPPIQSLSNANQRTPRPTSTPRRQSLPHALKAARPVFPTAGPELLHDLDQRSQNAMASRAKTSAPLLQTPEKQCNPVTVRSKDPRNPRELERQTAKSWGQGGAPVSKRFAEPHAGWQPWAKGHLPSVW